MMNRLALLCVILGVMGAKHSFADFPNITNSEKATDQDWMSAERAAAEMKLPPDFTATVFASEPEVQNPIAMAWDPQGRLWIAENYTYADRSQRFDLSLRDRVIVLDGTGEDRFTTRKVFDDNLQMLTGIEVGHGGVWLMCPPKLLFIPDHDGDVVPDDQAEVVLDGFEVAKQNYHNFANGLRFGPDGWLYGRCGGSCPGRIGVPGTPDHERLALEGGIWRYHPLRKTTEVLNSGTTNPWGHDWNSVGEMFFVNTVNGHLWHHIPGSHLARPFTLDPLRRTYELIDFHADHWHFDTSGKWTDSRNGAANAFGGGHAHSGTMIYEENRWPAEYRDRLFTLNLHGRRANQERLRRRGSGYVATHADDFFVAADPWFRGMELSAGPDGNVFVLDWSDTGECHEHTGVHRTSGRIFKIKYTGPQNPDPQPRLQPWTDDRICDAISGDSKWHRRQARMLLAAKHPAGVDSCMTKLDPSLEDSDDPRVTLRILLAKFASDRLSERELLTTLGNQNEHLRAWAVRMLVDRMPADDAMGASWKNEAVNRESQKRSRELLPHLLRVAESDSSSLVRLALASSLNRIPVAERPALAAKLVAHREDAKDHNLPLLIWYGLIPCADDAKSLVSVAKQCELPTTLRLISRCVAEEIERQPDALDQLLTIATDRDGKDQHAILQGLSEGLAGWPSAPRPTVWKSFAGSAAAECQTLVRELSVVFGDGRAMDELINVVKGKTESTPEIQLAALERLIQIKPPGLRQVCESLLGNGRLNVTAAKGLAQFDDPEIAEKMVQRYRNIRAPYRPQIISILSSRVSFAKVMLKSIREGKISRDDLTAFEVRQILASGDPEVAELVRDAWGEIRETPEERLRQIANLKQTLTPEFLAASNKPRGRELFKKNCQNCHQLYGEGGKIGPDLTGANRSNLDYLLGNIIDPSSVVDRDFRMTVIMLDDNRVLSGLVTDRNEENDQDSDCDRDSRDSERVDRTGENYGEEPDARGNVGHAFDGGRARSDWLLDPSQSGTTPLKKKRIRLSERCPRRI